MTKKRRLHPDSGSGTEADDLLTSFEKWPKPTRAEFLKKLLPTCEWEELVRFSNDLVPLLKVDFVARLPKELVFRVLKNLDAATLGRCAKVNKTWKRYAEDDNLWERMCNQHTGHKCPKCGWGLPRIGISPNQAVTRAYKTIFVERLSVARNWERGKFKTNLLKGHTDGVMCVQLGDGIAISGSYDHTIRVWNLASRQCTQILKGHERCVRCLKFVGNKLVSGSMDGTIKMWDLKSGTCWRTLTGHLEGVLCLDFDENRLVSGSVDSEIKVWNFVSGECVTLQGHSDWVNAIKLCGPEHVYSASDDCSIKLWDLKTNKCVQTLTGHVGQVSCLDIVGSKLISGSMDNTLKIWDMDSGECLNTLFGHTEGVWCLRANSLRIISGSHDCCVKFWDMWSGKNTNSFYGHDGAINAVDMSEAMFVSGADDGLVRVWDFGPDA
eukprot:NODE_443_length_1497_cov_90.648905_g411_i0.p1 GENE.NODE_443_length_1497_cov_90.648905_g411_i0~~NODE_443_length_1497_cov_90.648905_g411_i0.p1  ORF type:complete len:466 (+),score=65.24 NODE_443_length_1497_cov_90.648905_g411_i0:85-1398(+)